MALVDVKPRVVRAPYDMAADITLAAACVAGDLLQCSAGWILSDATTLDFKMVALEDGAIGDVIRACPFALIMSFTGGTAGAVLSTKASGAYQSGTGRKVGVFVSATEAYVLPLLVAITT